VLPKVAALPVWLAGDVVGNESELVGSILLLIDKSDGEADIVALVDKNGVGTVFEAVAIIVAVRVEWVFGKA
jgi:hypothetical protein